MGVVVRAGGAADPLPLDASRLGPGQVVVDLIYHPPVTPLLEAARARGAVAINGLGMLIHQAALAFRAWTGEEAPLEVMSDAALARLSTSTDGSGRSEERRGGKERVSTGRCRWAPEHE